jgi:hypothetical protein
VTLHPGDLIFTGSPSGIGLSRNPQVYLLPGQVMTTEVEGIGQMVNRLVAEELGPVTVKKLRRHNLPNQPEVPADLPADSYRHLHIRRDRRLEY